MIQLAAGLALTEQRDTLSAADVEWVAGSSQLPFVQNARFLLRLRLD